MKSWVFSLNLIHIPKAPRNIGSGELFYCRQVVKKRIYAACIFLVSGMLYF